MLVLDPIGAEEGVLPAFFIGWEVPYTPETLPRLYELEDTPPWLFGFEHTAGGYTMRYPVLVGVVLRLEANLERGRNNPAEALRAIKGMQEDARMVERDFPALFHLLGTFGHDDPRQALDSLQSFLQQHFDVPAVVGGIEALIQLDAMNPLACFRDWRVFSCSWSESTDESSRFLYIDSSVLREHRSELILEDSHRFDAATLEVITRYGRQLGLRLPPQVYFLWENLD